jgi:Flp pilus assembly protein TadD
MLSQPDARAWRAEQILERKDGRPIDIRPDAIVSFMCVRNELLRLPYSLSYYRRLGISRFFVIDNDSSDGTLEYLLDHADVHVWHTARSFREARCGTDWIELLLQNYGVNRWCLVVDADELLCYPDYENRRLEALCADLDREGKRAFLAILVDMYSDKPVNETHYRPGLDFRAVCPFFDRTFYHLKTDNFSGHDKHPSYFGGLRRRVFGGGEPGKDDRHFYCLNKVPLIKYDQSLVLSDNLHWTSCNEIAEETGCLLHFKYFSSFLNSAREEFERKEHWNYGIQYAQYAKAIKNNPNLILFSADHSIRFQDSRQLVALGIMRTREPAVKLMPVNETDDGSLDRGRPAETDAPPEMLQTKRELMHQVRALIRSHKKDSEHPHLAGAALLKEGDLEGAAAAFRRGIELHPNFFWSYHKLGDVLALQEKSCEAIETFRRAIELNPQFAMSHSNLGDLLMKEGKLEEAIVAYRTALQLQPDLYLTAKSLARALVEAAQAHVEEAKSWYRWMHKLNPGDAEIYNEALTLRPVDPELCVQFADTLITTNQSTKAIFFYQLALMAKSDDARVLARLAKALEMEKETDQAISCCHQAIRLDPNQSAYHRLLGDLLADQGRVDEATAAYQRAGEIEPSNAGVFKRLGDLLAQQGRVDEASVAYQRAIDLGYKTY